ncbi:MAG: DUF488 domain-containing protein [Chloroflexota bacterium]|nr:DUF488 domain-containing protein [Chloroflexota bacterium]
MPKDPLLYTIGHSDHDTPAFIDLLRQHTITLVADVRSQPYSRWTHQFNREIIARDLEEAGIRYRFMGDALGGRPSDPALYEPGQERPDYGRVEQTDAYQTAIAQLIELARTERVAVMCSEGDHVHCHRNTLITQTLLAREVRVLHIQPDGKVVDGERIAQQLSLFD